MICDNETGQCTLSPAAVTSNPLSPRQPEGTVTVHYVGDPMCSWCWGIADSLKALQDFCRERGFQFVLTNGGLRAGGGDEWNAAFRQFLKNEWHHINNVTGQPFSYALLDLDDFNYDTEPACRAVVSAYLIRPEVKLQFFHETQKKFYTESADPKDTNFYQSVCHKTGIDYAEFREIFTSDLSANETCKEFRIVREYGVNSFPTILIEKNAVIKKLVSGYIDEQSLIEMVTEAEAKMY